MKQKQDLEMFKKLHKKAFTLGELLSKHSDDGISKLNDPSELNLNLLTRPMTDHVWEGEVKSFHGTFKSY